MPTNTSNDDPSGIASPARRRLFSGLALVPVVVASAGASQRGDAQTALPTPVPATATPAGTASAYRPAFFNPDEWAFLQAACERLIPRDETGPGALEVGVPEFLDRHMQTPYAAGDIWYTQGPYLDAPSTFGYQGRLPLRDILRVGIAAVDAHCTGAYGGKRFAQLAHAEQETILKGVEAGKIKLDGISATVFFGYLLSETRNGYFADPSHGGNKGMAGWKAVGYPGMRADYLDWVGVRDRPYPIPPVDLAGRRG